MKHVKKKTVMFFNRHSIKQEIALVFIAVMAGTIVLCWIINNIFLENFYIQNKKCHQGCVLQDQRSGDIR